MAKETCSNCGQIYEDDGGKFICPYCGHARWGEIIAWFIVGIVLLWIFFKVAPGISSDTWRTITRWATAIIGAVGVIGGVVGVFQALTASGSGRNKVLPSGTPQQAIADFTKALELMPQEKRTPLLKKRATVYKELNMIREMEADWEEIINLVPETVRFQWLRERAAIHKDLGMMPEFEADWDKIIEVVPADERVKTLREQADLYKKLELVQKFRTPREEFLTKMNPDERTRIDCKNASALQIPRRVCVYCGTPITRASKGTIDVSYYGNKAKISYKFPLCDECDEGRNKEVESAVKISNVKEKEVLIAGMVDSLTLEFVNPTYAKAFLSANS